MPDTAPTVPSSSDISLRDICLDLISADDWRVRDRRFDAEDDRAVLGFIQRHGFDYDATRAEDSRAWKRFGSLSCATGWFAEQGALSESGVR